MRLYDILHWTSVVKCVDDVIYVTSALLRVTPNEQHFLTFSTHCAETMYLRKVGYDDHIFNDDVRRMSENTDFEVSVINYQCTKLLCFIRR